MKNKTSCKSAFTLIELLVVVLIIGILASIALPQYQKAVWKSRNVQLKTLLSSIEKAQKTYYMANGEYARNFNELDVEVPYHEATGNSCGLVTAGGSDSVRYGKDVQLSISPSGYIVGVWTAGPYKCAGFQTYQNRWLCIEIGLAKKFCAPLEKATFDFANGSVQHYTLP